MSKTIEYAKSMRQGFSPQLESQEVESARNEAEWARWMGAEIKKQGETRAKTARLANGEVIPETGAKRLQDTISVPDLAAVEASLDRSQLLLEDGLDVAAMGIDAALSIGAENSIEKMLAHQLAAAHKTAMKQIARAHIACDTKAEAQHLRSAFESMRVFQQGLLALRKVKNGGQQRITVQYVQVRDGGQAVIGNIEKH
jgi:hypothetical protein